MKVYNIYNISTGQGVYETTVKSERMAKSICRHANKNGERNKMYLEAEE
ncbi:MAG: hypothetical protein IJJ56_06535 [Prevotella sp.]|jgi:hypothetical protein|nr:hypothetical protein [Prevotella sp.]